MDRHNLKQEQFTCHRTFQAPFLLFHLLFYYTTGELRRCNYYFKDSPPSSFQVFGIFLTAVVEIVTYLGMPHVDSDWELTTIATSGML